jgi:hypothetical protein
LNIEAQHFLTARRHSSAPELPIGLGNWTCHLVRQAARQQQLADPLQILFCPVHPLSQDLDAERSKESLKSFCRDDKAPRNLKTEPMQPSQTGSFAACDGFLLSGLAVEVDDVTTHSVLLQ